MLLSTQLTNINLAGLNEQADMAAQYEALLKEAMQVINSSNVPIAIKKQFT